MKLTRKEFREDGIFGELLNDRRDLLAVTLEHSYPFGDGYAAKVPPGEYKCVRRFSPHLGYEVFEITGVPDHDNILIHVGNYNDESDGCVLLGTQIGNKLNGGKMVMSSRVAFNSFMKSLDGIDEFLLTVE